MKPEFKRTHFELDEDLVERIIPLFDGDQPHRSKTYRAILKDGSEIDFPCTGPNDFPNLEIALQKHKKYKDLKVKKDKEGLDGITTNI